MMLSSGKVFLAHGGQKCAIIEIVVIDGSLLVD